MLPAILWLQDDSGVSGQVGAFLSTRDAPGSWSRVLLYDFIAHPPSGVNPVTQDIANVTAGSNLPDLLTKPGFIFGIDDVHGNAAYAEVVGLTPTIVDSVNRAAVDLGNQLGSLLQGAWFINGNWYAALQIDRHYNADGFPHVRIFKSADYVTWTALDTTNEPFSANDFLGIDIDLANKRLHVGYVPGFVFAIQLIEFNFATELWEAPYGNVFQVPAHVYILTYSPSTGITHVVLDRNKPDYIYFDGVAWTDPGITLPHNGLWEDDATWAILDPNGTTVHYVLAGFYTQIQAGAVVGTTFNLNTLIPSGTTVSFGGRGLILAGVLYIPYSDGHTGELYCYVSSGPLSSPTFSIEFVDDAFHSSGGVAEECIMVFIASASGVKAFFRRPAPPEYVKRRNAPGH